MHADSEINPNVSALAVGDPVHTSTLLGYTALIFYEVDQLEGSLVVGTVDTNVADGNPHYFGGSSEMLTRGIPVAAKPSPAAPSRPQTRARDLIAELSEINTQIHHIMFQVEKAVSRLATSA